MRVVVCGGRDYGDRDALFDALDAIHRESPITALAHGGAKGADALAGFWAASSGIWTEEFRADWDAHGRAAGPIRNGKMLREFKPDLVVAAPGGRGTADCCRQAMGMGIRVVQIGGPES